MTTDDRRYSSDARPTVETVVTARNSTFTYRVVAYRRLKLLECKKVVWRALQLKAIAEPEPGGETTLITKIGRREHDDRIRDDEKEGDVGWD